MAGYWEKWLAEHPALSRKPWMHDCAVAGCERPGAFQDRPMDETALWRCPEHHSQWLQYGGAAMRANARRLAELRKLDEWNAKAAS